MRVCCCCTASHSSPTPEAASLSPQGKPRQARRNGWKMGRRQVIKVMVGAVLRGCKKTAHLQQRAGVHSRLRIIASLFAPPLSPLPPHAPAQPASMERECGSEQRQT
ncbi:hypothetical protein HaLaN_12188, partial [Haematococcus lacustris]